MEIFLFPQKEACLCQDIQRLAGYGKGAKRVPTSKVIKTYLSSLKKTPDLVRGWTMWGHLGVTHRTPCFIHVEKHNRSIWLCEDVAEHELWPKVFIVLISPKTCRWKGDFESSFSIPALSLNCTETRHHWWKLAMEFGRTNAEHRQRF